VVFKDALAPDEVRHTQELIWKYLEGLGTGISRDDGSTWGKEKWPRTVGGGLVVYYGIGQSEGVWYVRGRKAVKQAFEQIYGTDELLVSFDGVSMFRPWSRQPELKTGSGWWHVDQDPLHNPEFDCVQGLVNLLPSTPHTGGNTLVPSSHKRFGELAVRYRSRLEKLASRHERGGGEGVGDVTSPQASQLRLDPDDPILIEGTPLMLHLEAGDLLLWDSRVVHCNSSGLCDDEQEKRDELLRQVVLVCMTPRVKASPDVLAARESAVSSGVTTTHWPHKFQPTEAQSEALYGRKQSEQQSSYTRAPPAHLNADQWRLVGLSPEQAQFKASPPKSKL